MRSSFESVGQSYFLLYSFLSFRFLELALCHKYSRIKMAAFMKHKILSIA